MSVTSEDTAIPASLPHTLCLFIECPLNQEGIPHPEGIYLESKERLFSEKEPFPSPVIAEALLFVEEAFHRACRALQALNAGEDVEMSEVIYMDSVSIVERYRFYHSSTHLPRSPIQKSRRISWPSSLSDTYPKARTLLQVTDEKLKTIYAIQEKVRREIREKVGIEVKGETMKDRLNRLEKEVAELTLSLEAMKKENESLTAQVQKSRMNYFNLLNARRHGLQIEGSKPQTKAVPGGIVAERIAAVEKKIQTTQKLKAKLEEAASTQLMLENGGSYTQAPVLPPRSLLLASEEKRPSTSGLERRIVTHGTQTAQQTSTDILLGKDSEQGLVKDSSSTGSRCKPNRRWSRKFVSWLPIAVLATVGRGL